MNMLRNMSTTSWHQRSAKSFQRLEHPVPVLENRLTQMKAGPAEFSADLIATERTFILIRNSKPSCTLFSAFDPRFIVVAVPLRWQGDYVINGRQIDQSDTYICTSENGVFSRFESLSQITIGIERLPFVETIAALGGIAPERVNLDDQVLTLAGSQKRLLIEQLTSIYKRYSEEPAAGARILFDADVQSVVAAAYQAATRTDDVRQQIYRPEHIVRKAEDRFDEANWGAVTIADLCAAAGVSERTLNRAFHSIYGEAPSAYFHKRRLAYARSILLKCDPVRGRVTHAALSAGLTEFGRFSREYRQMFGEAPCSTNTV